MNEVSSRDWPGRGGRLGERVVLVVSVDTECDKGLAWRTQFPLSFRSVTEAIPKVLMPLFRHHGVLPTFLLSPEVIRDDASVRALAALDDCELGTHLHGEFIEPYAEPDAVATLAPQSRYSAEVEREKLTNLTGLFECRFGRRPTSFRAGRFAATGRTVALLDDLGYLVDSSVTPFRTNVFEGTAPCNHWGAPLRPYRPSASDVRRQGNLNLLEVPVTILAPSFASWPACVLRLLSSQTMRHKRALSAFGLSAETFWIRPFRGSADQLAAWADLVIGSWRGGAPVILNVMFHSVEAMPGASPYAQTEDEVMRLTDDLGRLFRHLRERYDIASMRLSDLHAVFSR